jgi:hypothetical protein
LFRDPHIPYIIKRQLNSKLYSWQNEASYKVLFFSKYSN